MVFHCDLDIGWPEQPRCVVKHQGTTSIKPTTAVSPQSHVEETKMSRTRKIHRLWVHDSGPHSPWSTLIVKGPVDERSSGALILGHLIELPSRLRSFLAL